MQKNFLITTGGSGGHVTPAIILHDHLLHKANIYISTDKRGLKFLDKNFYQIEIIDTPKLSNIFLIPLSIFKILFLILKSFFLLKEKKIEKIFSTGGYMSLPIILSARLLKIKTYLIEPNQVLGRANKFFLNSCEKIFCYSEDVKNFPKNLKHKIVVISPLVKENAYKMNLNARNKDKFTLLVVGGSQGAKIFDQNLKNSVISISEKKQIKIIQQTNKNNISYLKEFYTKNKIENEVFDFHKDFLSLLLQSDLCITRAGASTLAELAVLNIPFIAVPLPSAKDNHQLENANFYRKNNCCWLIQQDSFDEKIEDLLEEILMKKSEYLLIKENLEKLNYQNTWNNVNQKILRVINEN